MRLLMFARINQQFNAIINTMERAMLKIAQFFIIFTFIFYSFILFAMNTWGTLDLFYNLEKAILSMSLISINIVNKRKLFDEA